MFLLRSTRRQRLMISFEQHATEIHHTPPGMAYLLHTMGGNTYFRNDSLKKNYHTALGRTGREKNLQKVGYYTTSYDIKSFSRGSKGSRRKRVFFERIITFFLRVVNNLTHCVGRDNFFQGLPYRTVKSLPSW